MNAHAILTSQGWLGSGHALDSRLTDYGAPTYKQKGHRGLAYDPTSNSTITAGNGLVRPLLISQRSGVKAKFGIGKKAHEAPSSNDWWLKGFQTALSNIGKSESERSSLPTSGTSTPNGGVAGKHGGLYGYFVAGQMMQGTIGSEEEEAETRGKKRKSDVLEETVHDPLFVSPVKRLQTAEELENSLPYLAERDKGRKKKHERAQSTDIERFAIAGRFFEAADPETKIRQKEERAVTNGDEAGSETEAERKARRRKRKEQRKLTLAQMVEEEMAKLSSMNSSEAEVIDNESSSESKVQDTKKKQKTSSRQRAEKAKD